MNLNTESVNEVMNKVFMGKDNDIRSFSSYLGIGDFVTIEQININTQNLGKLSSATIKVSFLKAILAAAKTLTSLTPPFSLMVDTLKWLLDNVIKVDTGLKITPSLSAEVISGISSSPRLVFDTDILTYDQDISSKKATSSVSQSLKESRGDNEIDFSLDPIEYALSFTSDWTYYLDVDIDFLSLDVYHNSWSCNLGTSTIPLTKATSATRYVACTAKLDEPVHVTSVEEKDGEISMEANDNSGISNVEIAYSTDLRSWSRMKMIAIDALYRAMPILSVEQDTTVYYYLVVTDGDNDTYSVGSNENYYTYLMKTNNSNSDWINNSANRSLMLLATIVAVLLALALTVTAFIRKKSRSHVQTRQRGHTMTHSIIVISFIRQ